MIQRPPELAPSETYRHWKRRQRRLLILLAVLVMLEIFLVVRGVMLLPSGHADPAVAAKPSATATLVRSPTATPNPPPPAPSIDAAASMLVNASDGDVLFTQNIDAQLPMASTTKIMTALLALQYGKLDQQITIGSDAVAAGAGDNSHMGVSQGEILSLRDLLYGLMLPSGDDAAVAIADGISGNQQAFVQLMNARAQFLGLTHTHYANPNGLDAPGNYTSASDLVKLAEIAMRNPIFDTIVATQNYTIPATDQHKGYPLSNTNALLSTYDGTEGIKTGTTGNAGACLVFAALRNDAELIGVVLGAPDDPTRYSDARALLDWGFTDVADTGQ
jgi:D-alanyl-D-alanine carboxypeptidase (penicillin-binding protein 5/6)